MRPSRLRAYLSGAGLLSRNSTAVNFATGMAQRCALAICPCRQARNIFRHKPGATLDVTEMQPLPPCEMKANAVASSPVRSLKSGPSSDRSRVGRVTSPVASLRPIIPDISASRAIVSSASPQTVRDGTSIAAGNLQCPRRVHFGFVQVPDIPAALRQAKDRGCPINLEDAIYFGARDTIVCSKRRSWPVRAGLRLFTLMFRNSVRAVDLFNIPSEKFVEIGRQIEI